MPNPVAAYVMNNEKFLYASTRTGGAPGSGTWAAPVTLFDVSTSDFPSDVIGDISAGDLGTGDDYGLILNLGHVPVFIGNGVPPDTAVRIGPLGVETINNFFGTSLGAATWSGAKFAAVRAADLDIAVYSDADGWIAELDAAGAPSGVWADYASMQRVDGYFYFFLSVDGGANWAIYPFNLSTSLWEPSFAPLTEAIQFDWLNFVTNGLYKFANGDFAVLYNNASNLPVYRLWSGSWGAEVPLAGQNYAQSVIDPGLELIHNWNYNSNSGEVETSSIQYNTITHAGVASAISTIPAPVFTASGDGAGHPAILNSLILLPRDDTQDEFNSVWVADLAVGTFSKESLPVPAGEEGGSPTCDYMVFPNGYSLTPTPPSGCTVTVAPFGPMPPPFCILPPVIGEENLVLVNEPLENQGT